eukprot:361135-Chlamydomonas_euryale.AAC.6
MQHANNNASQICNPHRPKGARACLHLVTSKNSSMLGFRTEARQTNVVKGQVSNSLGCKALLKHMSNRQVLTGFLAIFMSRCRSASAWLFHISGLKTPPEVQGIPACKSHSELGTISLHAPASLLPRKNAQVLPVNPVSGACVASGQCKLTLMVEAL